MNWQQLKTGLHHLADALNTRRLKPSADETSKSRWLGWDGWVNIPEGKQGDHWPK